MVKRYDFSFCLVFSLILHSLFVLTLWGWMPSFADTRPSGDVIMVSIVQAPPMRAMAAQASVSQLKAVSIANPLPLEKILTQEKKVLEPIQEEEQPPTDTQAGRDAPAGAPGGMASGMPGMAAAAGTTTTEGDPAADRALANARDAYTAELYHLIKKYFVYPAPARRRGQEGKVQLSFIVGDDGRAQDIQVVGSSGFGLLDRAAVDTIRKIPLPPPPRRAMQIPLTIVYRLEEGA